MNTKTKITVTREHWDRAVAEAYPIIADHLANGYVFRKTEKSYCQTCVLAQAFKDAGYTRIAVGKGHATLDDVRYKLPQHARYVLDLFDKNEIKVRTGRVVEGWAEPQFPVEFEIELV